MILAVDLGSTGFKAALFTRRLREVRFGSRPVTYRYGAEGRVELPVAGVESALRGTLADALGADGGGVEAVAITSQAQTFTLLDAAGKARMPFISWRDGRPAAREAAIRLARDLPDFGAHAGFGDILAALQLAQLAALRPARTQRPVLLPAYVLRLLTGAIHVDTNQAAMTGLYSLCEDDWWTPALEACGLRAAQMPGLIAPGAVAGTTGRGARRFGLPAGIPVVLAGNDQTAGAFGAGIDRQSGGVLVTLGTAIAVYAWSDALPPARTGCIRGPYPGGGFYRMTADSCGGGLVKWAQTLLAGCGDDAAYFAAAARAPADAQGLRFEPVAETGGGDWRGGGPAHGPGDFARAVLACLSRRTADRVADLALPSAPSVLLMAGGGSRRKLWRDMIAAATGVPTAVTRATPLRGAARLAVDALAR